VVLANNTNPRSQLLAGRRNIDWRHAKHALKAGGRFLNELREFTLKLQQGWVLDEAMVEVEGQLNTRKLTPDVVRKQNQAAAQLCHWLLSIIKYHKVLYHDRAQ